MPGVLDGCDVTRVLCQLFVGVSEVGLRMTSGTPSRSLMGAVFR